MRGTKVGILNLNCMEGKSNITLPQEINSFNTPSLEKVAECRKSCQNKEEQEKKELLTQHSHAVYSLLGVKNGPYLKSQ